MWIRTGNVNVTSASPTVNGGSSAPNFITNGVKPGYMFRSADGVLYEIDTVVSETQLTLKTNYLGSTLSNQSYVIIQLSAAAYSELLAQVVSLITLFQTTVSLTTLKVGSPTETGAVAAFLGALSSFEATGDLRVYFSKGAIGDDVSVEFAVAKSGRARIGLIGNNNIVVDFSTNGSSWTNLATLDITTSSTNPRFSLGAGLICRSVAFASLPASAAGTVYYCSDLGGTPGLVMSDGTGWNRMIDGYATVSSNADFTLTPLTSANLIRHTGTLTANRAVTLSTTGARAGHRFRITRTGSGAFNLNVGTGPLKALIQNTWCEVVYDGSAWYLSAYGAL